MPAVLATSAQAQAAETSAASIKWRAASIKALRVCWFLFGAGQHRKGVF